MIYKAMSIQVITEKEAYDHLAKPYNPPVLSESFSEEDFFREWHTVQRGLANVLKHFGRDDAYGQGDYYIGDSAGLSRGIGVCITSKKPLVQSLIPLTHAYLKTLDHSYEIDFTVSTRDGDFEVFVSTDEVKAWCPEDLLRKLGIVASVERGSQ